jgi:hypothetical protein
MSNVPFNTAPVEGRPWDIGAGVENAQNWIMQQQQKKHALEQMYIQNQQKDAELQRYQQQTPYQLSQDRLKGAQADAQLPFAGDYALGQQGRDRVDQVRGRSALSTEQSTNDATNMGNTIKALEGAARHLEMTMASSPMFGESEYQRFRETLPVQVRQSFPKNYTPETPKMIQELGRMLTNNPEHRRNMEVHRADNTSREMVGAGHDAASMYNADRGADSREEIARMKREAMSASTKQNFQQFLTAYAAKRAAKTNTPQDDQSAQMIEQMMINNARIAGIDPVAYKQWVLSGMNPATAPTGGRDAPPSAIPQPSGGGAVGRWNPQTRKVEPIGR